MEERSFTMSKIRSKNTKPEVLLRSALFKQGFRYRLHSKKLPGKPDIVLAKYKTVIFVHGCFWHLHKECRDGRMPKSNLEYWVPKLNNNVERDAAHQSALSELGWKVIVVWECEILKDLKQVVSTLKMFIKN